MPVDLPVDGSSTDLILAGQDGGACVRRSVLPGGVRLLTEYDPTVGSVSLGLWLPVGSRDELDEHAGSTHFLEHLLFKGTKRRTARDIAEAFDEIGGETNAVTAKEHTCYYGRVRSSDLPSALDVLVDMVTSSVLDRDAFATEREVILEELAMAQDDPTDIGHEIFLADVLGPTPLGRPVGGNPDTINALARDSVHEHYRRHYVPSNLVVTAVGDVNHAELAERVQEALRAGGWDLSAGALPAARRPIPDNPFDSGARLAATTAQAKGRKLVRDTEQIHLFLGGSGPTVTSSDRHTLSVLQTIFGGGMSSRLFQSVREQRGLAYSVYSFSSSYRDAGVFGMYAACRPDRVRQVEDVMRGELAQLAHQGVTEAELRRARGQITGSLVLGLEDTSSRMARLGVSELVHGRYSSVDESVEKIDAVTGGQVQALAGRLHDAIDTRVTVGPSYE
ncbi:M16 family metallopeptidase [Devriesea agamarum]|uniref:M16 family metallopeptidase n=1 Tax=Devriesea agamarum TaxID=472569 RepID=UPI00071D1AC0|nr:pitrilysin family protein [Devriesea agamarum]